MIIYQEIGSILRPNYTRPIATQMIRAETHSGYQTIILSPLPRAFTECGTNVSTLCSVSSGSFDPPALALDCTFPRPRVLPTSTPREENPLPVAPRPKRTWPGTGARSMRAMVPARSSTSASVVGPDAAVAVVVVVVVVAATVSAEGRGVYSATRLPAILRADPEGGEDGGSSPGLDDGARSDASAMAGRPRWGGVSRVGLVV
jgi:hypothetical protein